MKTIAFLTEKGNVSAKARAEIKAQGVAKLAEMGLDLETCDKGEYVQVGVDQNGAPIYVVYTVTVTQTLDVKKATPKAKAHVEVEIPDIFE